jgi:hypothetical protein
MAQIAASVEALSAPKTGRGQPARSARRETASAIPPQVAREIATASQKLNASAREVVEAIDDGLPRDLEKRYINGETEVFVKRLHDQRSKRMTASLARRYSEERLLRSRINGYIRLFEKLLDTLSETPGGSEAIDDVIGSQNGQVYLALAEAAGRVPEV